MIEILLTEYKKHKKLIISYMIICMVLSFFAGSMIPKAAEHRVYATEFAGSDTLLELNEAVLGDRLNALAGDYSGSVSISAEPFTALLFLSIVSNVNKLADNPLNMPPLPLDKPWILAIIAVFFVASKFMKSNSTTSVFGVCTLGYLEKFLGTLCILVIGIVSVVTVSVQGGSAVAEAAVNASSSASSGGGNIVIGALSALFSAFMGLMSLIVNFIVRTVFKGFEALQVIFGTIPFVAFLCEAGKAGLVLFLCAINVWFPVAGYVLNIIVFAACCALFRVCYYASKYFENIYFLPFIRKIFNLRDSITLIPKRIPRRLRKALERDNINPDFVIPAFVKRRHRNSILRVRPLRRLWLVHSAEGTKLFFNRYNREKNYFLKFDQSSEAEMFLNKGFTLYEIFRYIPTEKNMKKKRPVKDFSLVFSKDYTAYIDEIIGLTGYTDVVLQKRTAKEERRAAKLAARQARLEAKLEKKNKQLLNN